MTQLVISIIAHNRPTEARLEKKESIKIAVCILDFELQGCTYLFAVSRKYLVTISACRSLKKLASETLLLNLIYALFISFKFAVFKVVRRILDDTGHFSIHKCEKKNANQHDFRFHLSFHARCKPLHSNMSVMGN